MNLVMGLEKKPKKKLNKTIDLNDIDDGPSLKPAKKKKPKKVSTVDSFEHLTVKQKKDFGPENSTEECLGQVQAQMAEAIECLKT